MKELAYSALRGLVTRRGRLPGRVYLTFDDGPHPENTGEILTTLRQAQARATFFVTGVEVSQNPRIARRIVDEGHDVASHSWTHVRYPHVEFRALRRDIENTERILYETCGVATRCYRPPYGRLTIPLLYYAWRREMQIVMWSLDSEDDRSQSVQCILDNCRNARAGDIVLFHDDSDAALKALPDAIFEMRARGLAFGTVRELLPGVVR